MYNYTHTHTSIRKSNKKRIRRAKEKSGVGIYEVEGRLIFPCLGSHQYRIRKEIMKQRKKKRTLMVTFDAAINAQC